LQSFLYEAFNNFPRRNFFQFNVNSKMQQQQLYSTDVMCEKSQAVFSPIKALFVDLYSCKRKLFFKLQNIRFKTLFLFLSITFGSVSCTTYRKAIYKEDSADIVNPERGFYIPSGTRASNFVQLNAAVLKSYRESPQYIHNATYKVNVSLVYRGYVLDNFKDKPISQEFLNSLQKDFDAVREAGLKMIIRFAYTNTANDGNCNSEYKICPPYGDAPAQIVFHHIQQLKPLLQKNADVIAVMQEGFIGIWGENYFTDYFGDASTNGIGKITDSGWNLRNELLKRLLDALPNDRMIQVRTPQLKQKFVFGPSAPLNSAPLQIQEAFSGEDKSRIGFHNDCFLSSPDDYGTYVDYGSSSQPRKSATEILRKYIEEDTRFTVVGGETCDDSFSPQNDCEPAGHAETEMKNMHYSFLNAAYNTDVDNDWDSAGCIISIKKKLGYRFVLDESRFPGKATRGKSFTIFLKIDNTGYASPFNPRPLELVLRNEKSKEEKIILLKTDARFLFSGHHEIKEEIQLSKDFIPGKYNLFLFLPDANVVLSKRPEYCLRLANLDTWESNTGYNNLHQSITVK
jgi:Domain of unknown function (DUF4832)/Domain of unknown function (DUF4874)